jgi:hypothetical protein
MNICIVEDADDSSTQTSAQISMNSATDSASSLESMHASSGSVLSVH